MSAAAATNYLSKQNPLMLAAGVVLVLGVVYWITRKTVTEVADAATGLATGNNAITQNQTDYTGQAVDAYEGKGILGTLGATANSLSGGALASFGETIADWFSPSYDPNAAPQKTTPAGSPWSQLDTTP